MWSRWSFGIALFAIAACSAGDHDALASATDDLATHDADRAFVTQWGPTSWNSAGHPDGFMDCGPTSLLMAGTFLGVLPPVTPDGAEDAIRHVRDLTRGAPTPVSGATHTPLMVRGATAIGLDATTLATTASAVHAALDRGHLAVIAGDPRTSWGLGLDARGGYLHHYGAPGPIPVPADGQNDRDHFGHWVLAFGLTPEGRIIVGDPLSTVGTIEVDDAAIDAYFAEWPAKVAALELR
jgi:hypothetical protein